MHITCFVVTTPWHVEQDGDDEVRLVRKTHAALYTKPGAHEYAPDKTFTHVIRRVGCTGVDSWLWPCSMHMYTVCCWVCLLISAQQNGRFHHNCTAYTHNKDKAQICYTCVVLLWCHTQGNGKDGQCILEAGELGTGHTVVWQVTGWTQEPWYRDQEEWGHQHYLHVYSILMTLCKSRSEEGMWVWSI